ncbi:unnamed protein product [Miscanthus lutarioriparius]|uniref:Uncharacterized protein n=1 Tax=Miscanthus lutarioriparius TaxID=422564 RepID=A0A811QEP1_9POAL|nr:unnamed protein product [Miscanthus lutarioriparius]
MAAAASHILGTTAAPRISDRGGNLNSHRQWGSCDGTAGEKRDKSLMMLRERGRSAPRYFVEEVMPGVDETDLYRTWVPTSATWSPQEQNTPLENMLRRM